MYGTQQFGQQTGVTSQPQQELVKVIGQTVWNLRELENRIQLLKQECGVLCTTLGIPPHVVGLTGGLGGVGSIGSIGQGVGQGYGQGISPWTNPLLGGVNPYVTGLGVQPWMQGLQGSTYGIHPLQQQNPLLAQGWYY